MKPVLTVMAIICTIGSFAQQPGAPLNVLHYTYNVRLSDSTDIIQCTAHIRMDIAKATNVITLDLAQGMEVSRVWNKETAKTEKHNHRGDKLMIYPAAKLNAGQQLTIAVTYSGRPSDGLIISKNKFGQRTF